MCLSFGDNASKHFCRCPIIPHGPVQEPKSHHLLICAYVGPNNWLLSLTETFYGLYRIVQAK